MPEVIELTEAEIEVLERIEREEYLSVIEPVENPRDLETFARSLNLPPERIGDPASAYNPDGHLVQLIILRELSNGRWRRFVIIACTQDGKSWLMQILLFWLTCELGEAVVVGGPDMRIAQDNWRAKTQPAMEASGLKSFLPTSGPGSAGGSDVDTIQLNGGGLIMLLGAGGKNASGQAGRTARWALVDEFGKIKRSLSGKFDRRADSFDDDGRLGKFGTVEHDREDPLLEAYDLSSQGRVVWRCHHCRAYTPLEWEQVTADYATEVTARASVRIACARCGAVWTDAERKQNLRAGRLVHFGQEIDAAGVVSGPEPETLTCGVRWGALDSPRRSLPNLAAMYREALIYFERGNAQPLIDFFHDQLARRSTIDDGSEEIDGAKLAARSAGAADDYTVVQLVDAAGNPVQRYQVPTIPAGVGFLTAFVDQSKRRLWYMIRGHDLDGRTWVLAWGLYSFVLDLEEPTDPQRKAALDHVRGLITAGIPMPLTGQVMKPVIIGLDVADWPVVSFEWLAKNPGWIGCKGTGDRQAAGMLANTGKAEVAEPGWYTLRTYERTASGARQLLWLESNAVKTEEARALARPLDAPGTALLPRGLAANDTLISHLTSERYVKAPGGRFGWVAFRRNDWWDCAYGTRGLAKYARDHYPHLVVPPRKLPSGDSRRRRGDDFGSHLGGFT